MPPKFKHDCTKCVFEGEGMYQNTPVDWYTCKGTYSRTLIARYGDKGPEYASAGIGETVTPSRLVMAALASGLDLTQEGKDTLLKQLLRNFAQTMPMREFKIILADSDNKIGKANWLNLT
jgi:hypothetical protein